ncbi:MAG: hypothetical protein Q9227_003228 [Pyrenula ochraceoflavens]
MACSTITIGELEYEVCFRTKFLIVKRKKHRQGIRPEESIKQSCFPGNFFPPTHIDLCILAIGNFTFSKTFAIRLVQIPSQRHFKMQFTALLGLLALTGSAIAAPSPEPAILDARATCNAANPIAAFPVGGSCSGSGYGCSLDCRSIGGCELVIEKRCAASPGGASGQHENDADSHQEEQKEKGDDGSPTSGDEHYVEDTIEDLDPETLQRQQSPTPRVDEKQTQLTVRFSICLSPTYQVPVLWFSFTGPHAPPAIDLDAVYQHLVPREDTEVMKSYGNLGGISIAVSIFLYTQLSFPLSPLSPPSHCGRQALSSDKWWQNHPVTDFPAFFIHPCNTADALRELGSDGIHSPEHYLLLWLGLVGPCVGLHVPSKLLE